MASSPYFGCGFREKDASKFGAGEAGALRYSLPVLGLSIEMNTKPASSSNFAIEFRDVTYQINDILPRTIVSNISLTVSPGETLVLLGRSGSGKTTLLRLVNRLLSPSAGQVFVEG